jgi:hypothetical protein
VRQLILKVTGYRSEHGSEQPALTRIDISSERNTSGFSPSALHTSEMGAAMPAISVETWLLVRAAAEAADYVIIYEANRLHERIADLWAYESKAAPD